MRRSVCRFKLLWELEPESGQDVRVENLGAQGAGRSGGHIPDGVGSIARTKWWERAAVADIRLETAIRRAGGGGQLVFQGPLLFGAVNLPQIIDAGVGLRGGTGLDKIGEGD